MIAASARSNGIPTRNKLHLTCIQRANTLPSRTGLETISMVRFKSLAFKKVQSLYLSNLCTSLEYPLQNVQCIN